jgi:hypothetical protein
MDRIAMLVDLVSPVAGRRIATARRILGIPPAHLNGLGLIEKGRLLLALEAGLIDTEDEVREAAAEIAGRLGSHGRLLIVPLMLALQGDEHTLVRVKAAEALSLTGEGPAGAFYNEIVAALSNAIRDDPAMAVKKAARKSLERVQARRL